MEHPTTIGDTKSPRRALSLLGLSLLLWGCAAEPTIRMESDAARRRVDLVVRDAQAEVSTLRQEVAAARIAAAKKEAELPELHRQVAELQRAAEAKQGELAALRADRDRLLQTKNGLEQQVAELQRTAEAKQGELAALRADRDRLLQTKTDMEQQVAESPAPYQSLAEVAETKTKLKELEASQAVLTAELAQIKGDLARARGKAGGRAGKPAAARPMPEASTKPAAAAEALTPSDRRPVRIAVERGDSLDLIARLYGVSVADLKAINGLRNDLILVGQELVIPRPPSMGPQPGPNGR
ncbi:MAG: LysM peptidoglycan-binding domain-containing protein [Nitrospirae bacterium]|nr:MAG: LysM peptidoglycan-binding domain-containing protein [Nitrospirota bacterium]